MILKKAQEMISLAFGGAYAANVREVKTDRIYDTRYFGTTANDATFFTVPVGGQWAGGTQKSLNETNMRVSGQLPKGQDFLITHISAKLIVPMGAQEDSLVDYGRAFIQILQSSYFEFKIANKVYDCQFHGTCLMPKPFYAMGLQVANNQDSVTMGRVLGYGWWDLAPVPIPLGAEESFSATHYVGNPVADIATELDASSTVLNGVDATMQFVCRGLTMHRK